MHVEIDKKIPTRRVLFSALPFHPAYDVITCHPAAATITFDPRALRARGHGKTR